MAVSFLPWGDQGYTSSEISWTWTPLDDLRVMELDFEASRQLVIDNMLNPDVAVTNALMADQQSKDRIFERLTQIVMQMGRLTIYNDKQLWLAFKFLDRNGHDARIEVAPEVEREYAQRLRCISVEYFRRDLPYTPNDRRFSDTYLTLNVADIDW